MEWILSGYCRCQDQARTVILEKDETGWDCDCSYPDCTFAPQCTLGQQILSIQEEQP